MLRFYSVIQKPKGQKCKTKWALSIFGIRQSRRALCLVAYAVYIYFSKENVVAFKQLHNWNYNYIIYCADRVKLSLVLIYTPCGRIYWKLLNGQIDAVNMVRESAWASFEWLNIIIDKIRKKRIEMQNKIPSHACLLRSVPTSNSCIYAYTVYTLYCKLWPPLTFLRTASAKDSSMFLIWFTFRLIDIFF